MITISKQMKGSLALLAASFVWGMAFSAQSNAMRYIQPFTFVFMRSAVTFIVLLAAMPLFKRLAGDRIGNDASPASAHVVPGAIIGVFLSLATILQQVGLVYTTPAKSGFVTALYIVIVPLLGLFTGHRVRPALWLGLALSLVGLALLCVQTDLTVNLGDVFTLGSAVMYSFQIIMVSRYTVRFDALKLSAAQFATCTVISGAAALIAEMLVPGTKGYMVASHLGSEPALPVILEKLGLKPVIDARMALGEGTGAALFFSMLDTVMTVVSSAASFDEIAVEQYTRFQ